MMTSVSKQKRELKPEQAAAAHELGKHISVTAGPGAGKTTVLVERYLHILRENKNLNIDQIVAITFTNRAANEMRGRLREKLDDILQSVSKEERQRWMRYKRTLDGAIITTIHGFCARLLREFPVEARIDPQFILLDEHRAAMLLEAAVEESLTEFISSGHAEISRLTLGVGRGRLAAALAQIYRDVRGQGLSLAEVARQTANSHATESDHAATFTELAQSMTGFLGFRRATTAALINQGEVSSSWSLLRPLVEQIPEAEALADFCRAIEGFRKVRPQARGPIAGHVQALDKLIWEKAFQSRMPQVCFDLFARRYALEMISLLGRIDDRLEVEKQKLSALDFDDLQLRALKLLDHEQVLARTSRRYKFFLVDEFQDTNSLQRALLTPLALRSSRTQSERANLFIVGDRKQSIYGFRGADVDVFRETSAALIEAGGEPKSLHLNFRSRPSLVKFFNFLFERLFQPSEDVPAEELDELGYVKHEPGEAEREQEGSGPLVELLIDTRGSEVDDPKAQQTSRERDAKQVARRIVSLVDAGSAKPVSVPGLQYRDIALLFRAMTDVPNYESEFRRANIPYQTVLGKGFYEREEITDLIQLLRFLDNKTDELALAAVLRSPLCGISDNALLALRCAPRLDEVEVDESLRHFASTRKLFYALRRHREIAFINEDEHDLLDRALVFLNRLIERRNHYPLADLLRLAVEESEYTTVVSATFDGAQRLANVQRLFTLADRFEHSGAHLIRDFVKYVEEFEAVGSRESEGQIDESANVVRLMTIHQAKGLEFPVVIIPDLHRSLAMRDVWYLLDRHRGLTLKVPDGRGKLVAGCTFHNFQERTKWREQFESMRLLYVAATRAEDRLILAGVTDDLAGLSKGGDCWLKWIWQSLELKDFRQSGVVYLDHDLPIQLTLNLADETDRHATAGDIEQPEQAIESIASLEEMFPLLEPLETQRESGTHRFSVTQLINYQRCARQYYFDRLLHAPTADQIAVWNDAEAPEPPANLTATLKGAVIHRFCETYLPGDKPEERLQLSLADVIRSRHAQLIDRLPDINVAEAMKELLPLAENYLASQVFRRIEAARKISEASGAPKAQAGVWSELMFRLRRPLGVLSGTIDKLLITHSANGSGLNIEIIDFKTNRLRGARPTQQLTHPQPTHLTNREIGRGSQFAFDFSAPQTVAALPQLSVPSLDESIRVVATDYQLQMQAYALAVRELLPNAGGSIKVTLHFLEPDVEFHLADDLLAPEISGRAIDNAMLQIISSSEPEHFPVNPAIHCRMCNFVSICPAGRDWLRTHSFDRKNLAE